MTYYLAIDLGASGGRHLIFYIENGLIKSEEVYRFGNSVKEKNGCLIWDIKYLYSEIITGLKRCKEAGKIPAYIGLDTWGVDFVLLDEEGGILGDAVSYRDKRTDGIEESVFGLIPEYELYKRTGIQKQRYNTIFQIYSVKRDNPELFRKAKTFLMLPDYFNYLLTGKKASEYTIATTSGLLGAADKNWDGEILKALGIPTNLFLNVSEPGEILGELSPETAREAGFSAKVALTPSHDTASAVAAMPRAEDAVFISSGTWSLIGAEISGPLIGEECFRSNFANEGGYGGRIRFLKNVMGLWIIQSLKKEYGGRYTFNDLSRMAEENESFPARLDVLSMDFLSPPSMEEAVKNACRKGGFKIPAAPGETCSVFYNSLAECYARTAADIEKLTGKNFNIVNIAGGGTKDEYLCRLTGRKSGKDILAGPGEASALGNAISVMIASGAMRDLKEAREMILKSGDFKYYLKN